MHAHIYARAYARSIVYMRTQFTQTNSLTTRMRVNIINASNAMAKPYLYTYVHAYARTYVNAVDREQYSQTNGNARTQTRINACKLIVAFNAWEISAYKRVCVFHVRSKTFRMYYSSNWICISPVLRALIICKQEGREGGWDGGTERGSERGREGEGEGGRDGSKGKKQLQ